MSSFEPGFTVPPFRPWYRSTAAPIFTAYAP